MKEQEHTSQDKRYQALARLREQFGKTRINEPAEVDNFETIADFLRRAEIEGDTEAGESPEPSRTLERDRMLKLRGGLRALRAEQTDEVAESDELEIQAIDVAEIIRVLPRIRDNIGNWLGRVDGEFVPNATPLEELERYLEDVQFRMKVLTVWSRFTQQELDDLQSHIQARRAEGTD